MKIGHFFYHTFFKRHTTFFAFCVAGGLLVEITTEGVIGSIWRFANRGKEFIDIKPQIEARRAAKNASS